MDCPSEENLIRMALVGTDTVTALDFDLAARRLTVTHSGEAERIEAKLSPLFIKINALQHDLTAVTPWFDRVFGAGEGVEFGVDHGFRRRTG